LKKAFYSTDPPIGLFQQGHEKRLSVNLLMSVPDRFCLGRLDSFLGLHGEFVHDLKLPPEEFIEG
jgi:hypothetical protein